MLLPLSTPITRRADLLRCQSHLEEARRRGMTGGAVVVKHGPIRHLGMPDMTMRFRLVDQAQASSLQSGDVVRFHAEKRNGMLVITEVARL